MTFDLQAHSTRSDGTLEPADVVGRAAAAGIATLSLTDHDTVDGVDEAIVAGALYEVRVIPGIELSTVDPVRDDLHLLGYDLDHRSPALLAALERFREDRAGRADRMADALRELGWALDDTILEERRAAGRPIGRPHLAAAAHGHPENAARCADEGLETPTDLLVAYLIEGAPALRGRTMPSVAEAIAVVHDAGGIAVWAHPFWDLDDPDVVLQTLARFAADGLDGVEAFYVTHTREQTLLLDDAAAELGLLTTGSADFHAPDHPRFHLFGAFELHGRAPRLGPLSPTRAPAGPPR